MKVIFAILLVIAAVVSSKQIKAHFVVTSPSVKATFDGYAYFEFGSNLFQALNAKIEFNFNGTAKNEEGAEAPGKGAGLIADPFLMNLGNIKVNGMIDVKPQITFNGICKISILDVIKPKIPFKGHVKFGDGSEADVNGLIDRPDVF